MFFVGSSRFNCVISQP